MTGTAVGPARRLARVRPSVSGVLRGERSPGALVLAVLVLLTGVALVLGFANKARCVGPDFNGAGRSTPDYDVRIDRDVCYSDIQHLWLGRDVDRHTFPYVDGSITPDGKLVGGTVEYPVLTGLLIWGGALFASTDGGFLLGSALLMAPFGLVTGWLLGRLARWRALLWALGPPLVLYAFHNWDLPVVACAVGAVFVVHGWRTTLSLPQRATVAAVLLGLGFAFKLYPGAFVLPLALYVLTRGGRVGGSAATGLDWRGALRVPVAAGLTVVLANLPFAIAGYEGWRASFTFQQRRSVDITTNSIWFWGFRPASNPDNAVFQNTIDWLSPTLVLLSFAVAVAVGWWRWRREGVYPWIGVSAAMLCGFLLLHKVHSPQYTLWLLPFFVLLQVPWSVVIAYLLADLAMGIGIFRWFYAIKSGVDFDIFSGFSAQAVALGVWGRAVLLAALFVLFLRASPALPREREPGPSAS
ncbi:glycosyltransferase family 87 protein [Pseudonocardia sp. H11422]|uniref:glycosyltransferase family 87 protein n=1 Tax=Pseudonocardia sp. H11422 TaxID=2835866 RepID=UPI0027E24DBD|nr:glycosyltransferase 87 family protein [Pseudonocardia sp. H11422]